MPQWWLGFGCGFRWGVSFFYLSSKALNDYLCRFKKIIYVNVDLLFGLRVNKFVNVHFCLVRKLTFFSGKKER